MKESVDGMCGNDVLDLLDKLIDAALDEVYEKDEHLIKYEAHERSIVFRFGHYLQCLMDEYDKLRFYNLDFEYNRNGHDPKRLNNRYSNGVLPDLIIHVRGSNEYNLLVMEFKPYWNNCIGEDCQKIRQFIDPDGTYRYSCGKSILLGETRQRVYIRTFNNRCLSRSTPNSMTV